MRDFNKLTPRWQPKRQKTGRWVVVIEGHTETYRPVPGEPLPKKEGDYSSCPPEAWERVNTYKAAQMSGGHVVVGTPGTLEHCINTYCERMDARAKESMAVTEEHAHDCKRNARTWIYRTIGYKRDGRKRTPIHQERMYNGQRFGQMKVTDIWAADVEKVFAEVKAEAKGGKGASHRTGKALIEALRAAFDTAAYLKFMKKSDNPARQVRHEESTYKVTEEQAEEDDKLERVQLHDINRLCEEALKFDQPKFYLSGPKKGKLKEIAWCDGLALVFAIKTNLRSGEHISFKWKCVDFENSCICVRTAARKTRDGQSVGPTKTKQSRRAVPLAPSLKHLLMEWKARSPYSGDEDRVFCTRAGRMQVGNNNWVKRVLHPACEAANIEPPEWHKLRHFFASIVIAMYKPSEKQPDEDHTWAKLAQLMGHNNPKETWKTYVHWLLDPKKNQKFGQDFDNVLSAAG